MMIDATFGGEMQQKSAAGKQQSHWVFVVCVIQASTKKIQRLVDGIVQYNDDNNTLVYGLRRSTVDTDRPLCAVRRTNRWKKFYSRSILPVVGWNEWIEWFFCKTGLPNGEVVVSGQQHYLALGRSSTGRMRIDVRKMFVFFDVPMLQPWWQHLLLYVHLSTDWQRTTQCFPIE